MKVGYLGPEGTFSEEASKLYVGKLEGKCELIPYATLHDVLYAVDKGELKEAVLPIENSIEGTIGAVTDMLAKEVDLVIRQEIIVPIYHNLIAQKDVKLGDITDVVSHPQGLDQCRDFIRKNLPKAKLHLAHSTSEAVRQVSTTLGDVKWPIFAAIGNKHAAKVYELKIIAEKINAKDNATRFIVLAKKDHEKTGKDKTSIIFSIDSDRPGGLHDVLSVFAVKNINLTKIESRPSKKALGDYYFFADMEGHRTDKLIAQALVEIKEKTSFLKILGSYPKA
ncbi:MAG: prephenate dehydratase [bacterium]